MTQDCGIGWTGLLSSLPQFPFPHYYPIPRIGMKGKEDVYLPAKEEKQMGLETDTSVLSLISNLVWYLSFPVCEMRWVVVPPLAEL